MTKAKRLCTMMTIMQTTMMIECTNLPSQPDTTKVKIERMFKNIDQTLSEAIKKPDIDAARITLDYAVNKTFYIAHLCDAALIGNCDMIRLIVTHRNGIPVNTADSFGRTALHVAAQYGRVDVIETLHALHANLNVLCHERTPLMYAALFNQYSAACKLLEFGANVMYAGRLGTAISTAKDASPEVYQLLRVHVRRIQATALKNWHMAVAPLELPIYIYLYLANFTIDIKELREIDAVKIIQGVMDSYRRIVKSRNVAIAIDVAATSIAK